MTLRLEKNEGSGWAAVDLEAVGVSDFRLQIGYSHPASLAFKIHQAHHTTPIAAYAGIRFWDDAATDSEGELFTSGNPIFLGFVEQINPADDGHMIDYVCYDPTARAGELIPIMSTAWDSVTDEGVGAVPRLVFNTAIDNDDDFTFCRAFGLTVGQMLSLIFDDAQIPLEAILAAAGDPYEATDLDLLDYIPQEKIVFTSEPIRSGVLRLINDWEPAHRLLFNPKTQKWRFPNILAGELLTRTLNDFTADYPILQFRLQRSLEGRYTAVKIYGPEAAENTTVTLSGGGLADVSDGPTLDTYGAGSIVEGKNKWQIVDEDARRMARLLPVEVYGTSPEFRWAPNAFTYYSGLTRAPQFQAKFKDNNAGTDAWITKVGWWYDHTTGILTFGDSYIYRYNTDPEVESSILQPNYENPEDVRLIYPAYIDPLSIRVPASGFEGTAFSTHGLASTKRIYDESLAVGFLYGTAVTSATRIAQFQVLAQKILDAHKDVLHTGGITFDGLDYEFHQLGRRVNVAGINGDGAALTTGWENIQAIVTDVEYDFTEETTTIQFSTDQSELAGFDPERTKAELKIGAAFIHTFITVAVNVNRRRAFTEFGTPVIGADVSITGTTTNVIIDPYFGTTDTPLFNTG